MGFFSKPDPVRDRARQFAKMLVAWRRKHPDRPPPRLRHQTPPSRRFACCSKRQATPEMCNSSI